MPEEKYTLAERLLKQHLGDQAARAEALNMANGPGIDGVPIYGDIIGSQRPALPRNEAPGGMMPVQQPGAMQIRGYLDENEEMTPMGEEFLALVDAGMFDDRGNLTAEGKAFGMTREEARDEEDNLESYMIRQKAGLDEDPDGGSLADVTWNLGRDFLRGGAILFRRAALGKYANTFTEREKADGSSMTLEERDAYDEIALQETGKQSLTGNATIGSGAASVLVAQPLAKLEGNEFKFYAAKQAHDRQVAEFNDASAGELWGGLTGSLEAINSLEKQAAAAEALIGPEQAEKARLEGGAASIITDPSTILTMGVGGFVGKGGVALSMTAKAEKAALARLAALEATSARAAAETVAKRSAELSRQAAARADNLQALGKDATMARGYSERMATRSAEAWDDVTRLDGVIAVRAGDVAKLTKDARVAEALLGIGERARAMRAVPFKAFGELAERMGAGIIKLDDGLREAATKYGFESVGKLLSNPLTPVAIGAVTAGPVGAVVAGAGRALASGPVLKSIGNFSRVVGAELMQRRGMIPFFQRVANNSTLTPIARATAHLLDTATLGGKAGIPLRMAGQAAKGTAAAAPIDMAFEWVEAGGDLGPAEMKQALAESIIFGGGAGVVAGSRNALQQQQLGDEINFRNGLVDREVLAFGRMNPGARRVLSSYAAANPALRFNLTTEGNSYMDRTSNTMTLNTRQSDWMAPIIGHEVSHFIQIKGQMEAGITAMLVGDGATGGILRAPDGALNPDFKRFADAYNGRLVAQGINPLPIGDIAIEYFTESTVDDITTMVESGELARMAGRSNAERMVREMSRNLIGRVPFIRDLSMKFGTGMDRGGRMVMGTGILADGVRTIPGARAMLRGLMREQAGRRGDGVISEESATIPVQIMRDDPAMRSAMFSTLETDAAGNPIVDANGNVSITSRETELRRMAAGLIITELEAERIQNGRQLPEGELAPQTDGSWQGTHLSPESLQRLADSGVFNAKQLAMLGMLNRSAKGLTGETFLMIYQAATIPRKGARKGYGTLPATFREVVPVGVKITKDGNIIVETMSVTQLVENVRERAASKRGKRLYNGSQVEILRDAQAVLDLHRKGERTDTYFADKYGSINGPEYKNFVNTAFGLMTRSQQDVNPIFAADSIRAGGVFKSRRLDRINQTTRMQGKPLFRFGYEQVKANLAPNGIPDPNIRMLPQEVPAGLTPVENKQQAEAFFADGRQLVAANEMDEELSPIVSREMLDDYSADSIYLASDPTSSISAALDQPELSAIAKWKKTAKKEDVRAYNDALKLVSERAKKNPEAIRLRIQTDKSGVPKIDVITDSEGRPVLDKVGKEQRGVVFKQEAYRLRKAPRFSVNEKTAIRQAADLLEADANDALKLPEVAKGRGWYGRMRHFLQRQFGANIEMFGQLLGASSARTPVDANFQQALDGIREFSKGSYDDLLLTYHNWVEDSKRMAKDGSLFAEWKTKNPTERDSKFKIDDELRKKINAFEGVPLRSNGKKFNANSKKVLQAIYNNWIEQTVGPKTPNFAGNLTGRTLRATIDVWAARNLRRLFYKGKIKQWRLFPEQEKGVNDEDFFFGQEVYEEVSRRIGIPADDLQALMWFYEKGIWEDNGWTNTVGAEKSSFDKEAGKLDMERFQAGVTTFTDTANYDPAVQESERSKLKETIAKLPGLVASRVTHSDGLYGSVVEPTLDVEFSVKKDKDGALPGIQSVVRDLLRIAANQKYRQNDVFVSQVVDATHPNARPMVEVGFKSPASAAEIDQVIQIFQAQGIDGFTVAKDQRGNVIGIRAQYIPEISARYDSTDHLDPAKFLANVDTWTNNAQAALIQAASIENISYKEQGHVSTTVYGTEEYAAAAPKDLRGASRAQELGRRLAILQSK